MAIVRQKAVVYGQVQGVCFRHFTVQEAKRLGLTGWVRNLADGSVEAEFQGEEEVGALLVKWLQQGPPLALVTRVEIRPCPPVRLETGFTVRY